MPVVWAAARRYGAAALAGVGAYGVAKEVDEGTQKGSMILLAGLGVLLILILRR